MNDHNVGTRRETRSISVYVPSILASDAKTPDAALTCASCIGGPSDLQWLSVLPDVSTRKEERTVSVDDDEVRFAALPYPRLLESTKRGQNLFHELSPWWNHDFEFVVGGTNAVNSCAMSSTMSWDKNRATRQDVVRVKVLQVADEVAHLVQNQHKTASSQALFLPPPSLPPRKNSRGFVWPRGRNTLAA